MTGLEAVAVVTIVMTTIKAVIKVSDEIRYRDSHVDALLVAVKGTYERLGTAEDHLDRTRQTFRAHPDYENLRRELQDAEQYGWGGLARFALKLDARKIKGKKISEFGADIDANDIYGMLLNSRVQAMTERLAASHRRLADALQGFAGCPILQPALMEEPAPGGEGG